MTPSAHRVRLLLRSVALAWLGVVALATAAIAHEGEEEVPARTHE